MQAIISSNMPKRLYLTNTGTDIPSFQTKNNGDLDTQTWTLSKPSSIRYQIISNNGRFLNEQAHLTDETFVLNKHGFGLMALKLEIYMPFKITQEVD